MADIITVDLTRLGKEINVPETEFTPPIPGAKPMLQQQWETPYVLKAIEILKERYKKPGTEISLFGHLDTWVCLAMAKALEPECKCCFSTPNHDENDTFTDLPPYEAKFGTPDPELDYRQEVREEGDKLFIDFAIGAELEWPELLKKVQSLTLPPIPEGRVVCLASSAMYPLQWVVLHNYAKGAKSVFCADHAMPAYRCAVPGGGYSIGDSIPRVVKDLGGGHH